MPDQTPETAPLPEQAPDLVDSHCHLDFPDFEADLEAVIARAARRACGGW